MNAQELPECHRYPGFPCVGECQYIAQADFCFNDLGPPPDDGVCTGMDIPFGRWTAADVAYWTGTPRYQPWKDVAALFRERETLFALFKGDEQISQPHETVQGVRMEALQSGLVPQSAGRTFWPEGYEVREVNPP